jgi:hypothetical protein
MEKNKKINPIIKKPEAKVVTMVNISKPIEKEERAEIYKKILDRTMS